MFRRLAIFLLSANIVITLSVGYTVYTAHEDASKRKPYVLEIETPVEDVEFQEKVYKAFGMLMSGQSQLVQNQNSLNMALYRVHHFAKPHVELHPNCPECEQEKQRILEEEKGSVTLSPEAE